jgi:dephospho-CoA kinase
MTIDKFLVGLTGMPGSGKTLVVKVAKELGYEAIVMGDIVRKEAEKRGIKPNLNNLGKIMLDLRIKEGPAAIAKRCMPNIEKMGYKVIVDGIRSLSELKEFKKFYQKVTLIAIHASPETRFKRIYNRKRSDAPNNWKFFCERDNRELKVGVGSAIAMAEHMIVNEDTLWIFKKNIKEFFQRIEKDE